MSRERLQKLMPFLLVALVVVGIALDRMGFLAPVEGFLIRVTAPIQTGVSSLAGWFGDLAQTARDLRGLRERNEALESENSRLLLEVVRLKEIEAEASVLRDLLEATRADPSLQVLGAHVIGRVIGRDPINLERYILVDVGREKGVGRNMPVVSDRGLIGRIVEVGDGWSRVLLIIDVSSSVNALTQSTRASGLVQGRADGSLVMRDIPQADTVSVGDTVFTSGLGGNFPRQILIGQITEVQHQDYDLYQVAVVRPTVDFDHLEIVLVVTGFRPFDETQDGARQ